MTREEFMIKAKTTARQILEGKENGIMNLVEQAYAEGKRHAEVETLREAIEEALNKRDSVEEETIDKKIYPTWKEWLADNDIVHVKLNIQPSSTTSTSTVYVESISAMPAFYRPIDEDIAKGMGIKPKNNKE